MEIKDLTAEQVKQFINSLDKTTSRLKIHTIARAVYGIRVPMDISYQEARMNTFFTDFQRRLKAVGYGEYRNQAPKKYIA